MKVGLIYPKSLFSAWSVSEGISDTLRRMGHDVLSCGVEPGSKQVSRNGITREALESCDLILVSGPEHIALGDWRGIDYVSLLFPGFNELRVKKVGLLHETRLRDDYPSPMPMARLQKRFDVLYTPAAQDETKDVRFLPFGVDDVMFQPHGDFSTFLNRPHGAVFVGLLYGSRAEFVNKHGLANLIQFGNCQVQDLSGVNIRASVELYAAELRRSKVLVNLSSLCRHAVTKITEGAACGAVVVTHKVEDDRNHVLKSAVYYETGEELKSIIEDLLANETRRIAIAEKQYNEVVESHGLESRLATILAG